MLFQQRNGNYTIRSWLTEVRGHTLGILPLWKNEIGPKAHVGGMRKHFLHEHVSCINRTFAVAKHEQASGMPAYAQAYLIHTWAR